LREIEVLELFKQEKIQARFPSPGWIHMHARVDATEKNPQPAGD
jgi:hypothetical protein